MEWIVARWLTFIATLISTGACAVAIAVIPRANADDDTRADLARDAARIGIVAILVLLPASLLRLTDQVLALRSPGDAVMSTVTALLASTMWGTGFVWQCAALITAGIGLWLASRAPRLMWRWSVAALGALGLCITPSLQGHAIGSEELTAVAVTADIAHVTGAALWLGSLCVIAWLGFAPASASGVVSSERAARSDARLRLLIPLMPPLLLPGAAMLVASGVASSWLRLRTPGDLLHDEWGRYVLAKSLAACAAILFGAYNWKRLGRRLATARDVAALRRSLTIELVVALLILVITAILVVTPLPGEQDDASRERFESHHFGAGRGATSGQSSA